MISPYSGITVDRWQRCTVDRQSFISSIASSREADWQPFSKTGITSAIWCWLTSNWRNLKANSKLYLVSKYWINQTMGKNSSIAKHLTRLCSSAPQKVRTNELNCVFGSVIHFSWVFCSGSFVESVLKKISYINAIFGRLFRDNRFLPQQCLLLVVDKIYQELVV